MKLMTKALSKTIPPLYATEQIPEPDKIIRVKYFHPYSQCTWYGVEYDGNDLMFGYIVGQENEWGYLSLKELESVGAERDPYFKPCTFKELMYDRI